MVPATVSVMGKTGKDCVKINYINNKQLITEQKPNGMFDRFNSQPTITNMYCPLYTDKGKISLKLNKVK